MERRCTDRVRQSQPGLTIVCAVHSKIAGSRRAKYFIFSCEKLAAFVLPNLKSRHLEPVLGTARFSILEQEKYS